MYGRVNRKKRRFRLFFHPRLTKHAAYDRMSVGGVACGRSETEASNPFRYACEYWDSESGLIYLRARYYDSGVGGFISEDPAKDGLNWYVYCGGDPVNYVDHIGLEPVLIRYVVEKDGGYVSYYENDGTNQGPRVDVTLFDSNNVAHTASFYHLTEVNDRLVIDSGALAAAVGYAKSDSELRHAEYDRFNSEADAVIAFGLTYHTKSLNEQQEYGATIDEVNGQYYFHDVSNSAKTAGKNVNDLTDTERRSTAVWGVNDNTTASAHTHWHPSGNLTFSDPGDYDATYGTYDNIERIYLVNRNGEIIQSTRNARLERGYTMGIKRFQI